MVTLQSSLSHQIVAQIVADSTSSVDPLFRIVTFEVTMPRFIWAECLTHRVFSRNAASSRAIPITKKIKQVWSDPALPVHWGKNQSGMQAKEELKGFKLKLSKFIWKAASKLACTVAYTLHKTNLHKQLANRVLEPFEVIKVVITSTTYTNWFWLRDHEDAQPEIREVAKVMRNLYTKLSKSSVVIVPGEWHLPYIDRYRDKNGVLHYRRHTEESTREYDLEAAKKLSASLCAQVSFRLLNDDLSKALSIFNRLIESKPVHSSPTEHQATPMKYPLFNPVLLSLAEFDKHEEGVTHYNYERQTRCSGNLEGFIQFRQLIKDNVMNDEL